MPDESNTSKDERPTGHLFTAVYRDRGEARHDDPRFRVQLHQAFHEIFGKLDFQVGQYLRGETGIELPDAHNSTGFRWESYFKGCPMEELLDLITHIAQFSERQRLTREAQQWLACVGRALTSRNMVFEIDRRGGMHHKVDAAFQRSAELTLACLGAAKFESAKSEVEAAMTT